MGANRDLLVMFKENMMSQQDLDRHVTRLHEILFNTERLDNFVKAHEILDLNRYKIVNNNVEIKKMLRQGRDRKPFIFFSNKN